MKKYFKKIAKMSVKQVLILVGIFLVFGTVSVLAINSLGEGRQVQIGGTETVDVHGVCKKVSVDSNAVNAVFVPTNTSAEWQAFRDNVSTNTQGRVTLDDCTPTCDRPLTMGTGNNPYCTVPDVKVCNTAGGYCQYWAGCNSNIGTSGDYYSGVVSTGKNASGWLYGKLYSKSYVVNNPTEVCGSGYRLPTRTEVNTLMGMVNCAGWDSYNVSCSLLVDALKLPLPGVFGRNQTYGTQIMAYRNKDWDGGYFFTPLEASPNSIGIMSPDPDCLAVDSYLTYLSSFPLNSCYDSPDSAYHQIHGANVDFSPYLATHASVRCIKDVVSCGECTSPFGGTLLSGQGITVWDKTDGYPCSSNSCASQVIHCHAGTMDAPSFYPYYNSCANHIKIQPSGSLYERDPFRWYAEPVPNGGWNSTFPGDGTYCHGAFKCSTPNQIYRSPASEYYTCRQKWKCAWIPGSPAGCYGRTHQTPDTLPSKCNASCSPSP